ncbi:MULTISPECIES: hypothetical protein [Streptomyces]|uniref:hypothetical protein n=1 Tax=Streptomyces TaxID=1883 RepID=UPI00207A6AAA|nr:MULTISPECIES: hypothetical protein [Streptomyces]MCM9082872.1 hypothetical protein [Streptomyces spororaveus]MCX5302359.1 hypothetical protein [Streptomyces sp. NBC_00160]
MEETARVALVRRAALNNAVWCDAVCRAHGVTARYEGAGLWCSPRRTPPMYPDAVTLEPAVPAGSVVRGVETASPGCSVKDSFGDLDLAGNGFDVLFEAQWIHRLAGAPLPVAEAEAAGLEWSEVSDARELAAWEAAFDGGGGDRLFRPALLREGIVFLAGRADGRIAAGAVASTGGGVVGVSNLFGAAWAGVLGAVSFRWPDLDVVGYEHGEDLEAAVRAGFTAIGPLRVWLRTTGGGDHGVAS